MIPDPELAELRHHYGDAYTIIHTSVGWEARRRDGHGGWITRATAEELLTAIRADYQARPVRRDDVGGADAE